MGVVSLHDPPRQDAIRVISALQHLGVTVKMVRLTAWLFVHPSGWLVNPPPTHTQQVSGDHRAIVHETSSLLGLTPVVLHVPSASDVHVSECNAFAEVPRCRELFFGCSRMALRCTQRTSSKSSVLCKQTGQLLSG